jgi:hypothetical protein
VLALAVGLGTATAAASLVNPFGVRAILFPLEVVNTRLFVSSTAEWFSPNFHNPAFRGLEAMLLLLVPAFAWGRARLALTDVLVALTFAHLALASARHVPLFAVAVAPLLADALQTAGRELWDRRPRSWEPGGWARRHVPSLGSILASGQAAAVVVGFALLVGLIAGWASFLDPFANPFLQDLNERRYPGRTMTFIKQERLPAPLFNAYAWGGYELWRLYPDYRVFIDGRTHVYGREVLQDFLEVTRVGPSWRRVLDRWDIQTILSEPSSPLSQVLLAIGGWRPVFAEREAMVFVRDAERNRALLARLQPAALTDLTAELSSALLAGLSAAESGDEERAIGHYRTVLRLAPDHPVALLSLGILREKRGEISEARALFERLVAVYHEGELVRAAQARLERLR